MNTHDTTKPSGDRPARKYLPLLLILFVGSGCAALIYEIVWLQLLQLVIGSSAVSLGVLLGTFMGGMCLGSLALPRVVPMASHPLRVYALLELGIGVLGIGVLFGLPLLADLYTYFPSHGILVRALVAAVCLVPPTLLMGATLPAIARWVESTREGASWMGLFYGGNIAGAVFGCLLAGFYLLRVYDMPTATYAAVSINLAVALIALALAARTAPERRAAAARPETAPAQEPAGRRSIYVVVALSGFCALGAEVIWTRLLSLMLGATVYTFSIILAVFLLGLGLGSSAGAFAGRSLSQPRTALGACQLLLCAAVAWAAWIIARSLPYWPVNPALATSPWFTFQLDLARTAWTVLPAAVLWGASFPLALASIASPGQDPGRMVGRLYAANTIGAIGGSLAFSMILIPAVGTQGSQRILILICALAALAALLPVRAPSAAVLSRAALAPAALAMALLLAWSVAAVPWEAVAFGRFSATYLSQCKPGIVREADIPAGGPDLRYCIYVREGMNVSVAVTQTGSGWRYFHGAGKVQASTEPQDMRMQRMLGHLSVLAHPDPDGVRDVLVVACGAGVTAGSFVPYPEIRRIDICDIEAVVPKEVSPMFGEVNYHVVDGIDRENPRTVNGKQVRVVYDDGRHFVRTTREKYDIITSDPIDPWVKGCAALNTVEYYRMCRDHLKPGGVMSLWIPLYESNVETAKSVLATFFMVFPNGLLFSNENAGEGYDAVLLGVNSDGPARIDVDLLRRLLDRPDYRQVRESILHVGFGSGRVPEGVDESLRAVAGLLSTYAGQAADLKLWMQNAQINFDRNLRLQYLAGLSFNSYIAGEILQEILTYYRYPGSIMTGSAETSWVLRASLRP